MEVLGMILSLLLLTLIAYRGYSVILFAPVCALLAATTSGLPLLPTYTEVFMGKAMAFAKAYFPLFMLGAVFGKIMEDTGLAKAVAHWIVKSLGAKGTIASVVLACAVLGYGGVSIFVVAFAVYPLGAHLFREAGIPKRLLPGAIALGSFTFAMTAFPGTPQIQNLIPVKYFGTDAYAAPLLGTIAGLLMLVSGLLWLEWRKNKAIALGEGYGTGHINESETDMDASKLVNPYVALLPLISVLALNFFLTRYIKSWDPAFLKPYGISLAGVAAIWALIIAVAVGIILALVIGRKEIKSEAMLAKSFQAAIMGSLLAIMNTASEVGYGSVISSLAGFKQVANFLMAIKPDNPLISEFLVINVLAGITGSASGGMSIALEAMGKFYLDLANSIGMSPELLHRVAAIASGGFDSLPHNGAIITLLAICGLTHKQSYTDIGVCSVLIPFASGIVVIVLYSLFGLK